MKVLLIPKDSDIPYELDFNVSVKSKTLCHLMGDTKVNKIFKIELTKKHLEYFNFYVNHLFFPPISNKQLIEHYSNDFIIYPPSRDLDDCIIMMEAYLYLDIVGFSIKGAHIIDLSLELNSYFTDRYINYLDIVMYFKRHGRDINNPEDVNKSLLEFKKTENLHTLILGTASKSFKNKKMINEYDLFRFSELKRKLKF